MAFDQVRLTGARTLVPWTEELSTDPWFLEDDCGWQASAILPEPVELPREWGAWDCEDNDTGEPRGPRRSSTGEWGPYLQEPSAAELAWLEYEARCKALEAGEESASPARQAQLRRAPHGTEWDPTVRAFVDVDPEPAWAFRATV